jgi:phosphatidylglycerol:prolipoprotein diacylglycerol transferase
MHSVLLRIPLPWGPPDNCLNLPAYGTALMVGFLLAVWMARRRSRCLGLAPVEVLDMGMFAIIGGVVGARLLHVAVYWQDYFATRAMWPKWMGSLGWLGAIAATWNGGLVFYGGLGGAILALWLYARRRRIPLADVLDFVAPGVAVGLAVTRVGCFLNGCCWGKPTTVPWGVQFPENTPAGIGGPVHPTQLYETAAALAMFGALWWFYPRRRFSGQTACLFGLLYSVWRFCNEFLRADSGPWRPTVFGHELDLGPLTIFQYISLLLLVAFVAALVLLARRGRPPYDPSAAKQEGVTARHKRQEEKA